MRNVLFAAAIAWASVLCLAGFAMAPGGVWINGKPASHVLCQPGFTTRAYGSGLDQCSEPVQAIVDPLSGKLFVVDGSNHRVLRYTSVQALNDGGAAEATLGGGGPGVTRTLATMAFPVGATVDTAEHLWITDSYNNRVLRFDNAATIPSGTAASAIIGGGIPGPNPISAASLFQPLGVKIDSSGRLWVADCYNNRVLWFDNAVGLPTFGAMATGVLGQPTFTSNTASATQGGMTNPSGLDLDGGHLWVADLGANRVLRFDGPSTLTSGSNANGVLGQPDFSQTTPNTTRQGFDAPNGVAVDALGRLYVADGNNNRILIFNTAASLVAGADASNVLGQSGFMSKSPGTTISSLQFPGLLFIDPESQDLLVGDYWNSRMLRFSPTITTAATVALSGRVLDRSGRGVRGAMVVFTDEDGHSMSASTNAFGYYTLGSVQAGTSYISQVAARGLAYSPRSVVVSDELSSVDFYPR